MTRSRSRIKPWWGAPEMGAHDDLLKLVETLLTYDRARRADIRMGMAMYGDRHALASLAHDYEMGIQGGPLSFNLVRSVANAAQAQIASQHTVSRVLTQRGNWTLRRKAKMAEQMIEGEFEANDVHRKAHRGFLDAAKGGLTGFKVYTVAGRTMADLIRPGSVLVDPVDGKDLDPRAIYEIAFLPRDVVLGEYGDTPELRAAIDKAPYADARTAFPWEPHDTQLDTIMVAEAWRRPDPDDWNKASDDRNDAADGRHVIAIHGATLLDDSWDRGLPFALWRYEESGDFYGRGIAQNLRATQREINYTLQKIQACLHMNAGFRIVIDGGEGEVTEDDITDSPGQIIRVNNGGVAPQVITSSTVPPEFRQHLEDCIRRGFEQEGVSMMAATSKKPGGLNSGEAIREYNDIESTRFSIKSKSFERFVGVDLAKVLIEEKQHTAAVGEEKPVRVRAARRRGVKFMDVSWGDVALDPEDYALQVSPSSQLPRTSAGRQATIDGWLGAGLLNREQYLMLSRNPDTDEFLSQELAPMEIVLDHLEDMIEDGTYTPPETVQDIALSLRLASNAYQQAKADGVPTEHAELILDYIDALKGYADDAKAAAQPSTPPAGPPGAAPPPMQ